MATVIDREYKEGEFIFSSSAKADAVGISADEGERFLWDCLVSRGKLNDLLEDVVKSITQRSITEAYPLEKMKIDSYGPSIALSSQLIQELVNHRNSSSSHEVIASKLLDLEFETERDAFELQVAERVLAALRKHYGEPHQ
jgi:hypothetical protein